MPGARSLPTIDREKVLAVLLKRFPDARLCDVAAAANAIVGLDPEYGLLPPEETSRADIECARHRYSIRHVATGDLRIYRRVKCG